MNNAAQSLTNSTEDVTAIAPTTKLAAPEVLNSARRDRKNVLLSDIIGDAKGGCTPGVPTAKTSARDLIDLKGSRDNLPTMFKNNLSNGGDSLERLTMEANGLTASRETLITKDEDDHALPVSQSAHKLSQYQQFMNAYSTEDLKKCMGRN